MKKSKLLVPILGTATLIGTIVPMASCTLKMSGDVVKDVVIEEEQKEQEMVGYLTVFPLEVDESYKTEDFNAELTGTDKDKLQIVNAQVENGKYNIVVEAKESAVNKAEDDQLNFGIIIDNIKDGWQKIIEGLKAILHHKDEKTATCIGTQPIPVKPKQYKRTTEEIKTEEAAWAFYQKAEQDESHPNVAKMFADDVLWSFSGGEINMTIQPIFNKSMTITVSKIDLKTHLASFSLKTIGELGAMEMVVNNVEYSIINHSPKAYHAGTYSYIVPTFLANEGRVMPKEEKWSLYYHTNHPIMGPETTRIVNQNSSLDELRALFEFSRAGEGIDSQIGAATCYYLTTEGYPPSNN